MGAGPGATLAFKAAGEVILLVGETKGALGRSAFLTTVLGRDIGGARERDGKHDDVGGSGRLGIRGGEGRARRRG